MEDINLVKYKWEHGVYALKQMITLVQQGFLTEEDFFDITRCHYNMVLKTRFSEDKIDI